MALVESEEFWCWLVEQDQQGTAHERQCLGGLGVSEAGLVLGPEGVAAPVIFVFDCPVALDEGAPTPGAMAAGLQAGDEDAGARGGRWGPRLGAFGGARQAQDSAGKGQAEGLSLHGDQAQFMLTQASVALLGPGKRGALWVASTPRAYSAALGWLSLRLTR